MELLFYLLASCVFGMWIFLKSSLKKNKGVKVPGPKGLPLLGLVLEVNKTNVYEKLSSFAKLYGDIVELKFLNTRVVSLNSAELIRKAFTEAPYKDVLNDRSYLFVGDYILHGNQSIASTRKGHDPVHNELRKGMTKALHVYGEGVVQFEANVRRELTRLQNVIEDFQGQGFEFEAVIKRSLSNLMSILLSGQEIEDEQADMFWEYDKGMDAFISLAPNTILTNLPFMRHLPGFFRSNYKHILAAKDKIKTKYVDNQKATYEPGHVRGIIDSLLSQQLDDITVGRTVAYTYERIVCATLETIAAGINKEETEYVADGRENYYQMIYISRGHWSPLTAEQLGPRLGSTTSTTALDRGMIYLSNEGYQCILTTLSSLCNLMICLLHHPEYQRKIQEELDAVVGRERLPQLSDRGQLPLVEAVIMESIRLITPGPILIPHMCGENVQFEGYSLEKDTMIVPNVGYVHHDEKVWGDPWTFRPERFLDDDGQLLSRGHVLMKSWFPFGLGRRQCIGEHLARSRLFLYTVTMLHRWTFVPIEGQYGSCDSRNKDDFQINTTVRANPFSCRVLERE